MCCAIEVNRAGSRQTISVIMAMSFGRRLRQEYKNAPKKIYNSLIWASAAMVTVIKW